MSLFVSCALVVEVCDILLNIIFTENKTPGQPRSLTFYIASMVLILAAFEPIIVIPFLGT